jgi:hypothetical protein
MHAVTNIRQGVPRISTSGLVRLMMALPEQRRLPFARRLVRRVEHLRPIAAYTGSEETRND